MKSVEFYFDLGSPYSYLAYYRLLQMAEQQEIQIVYKPILLGGVFKATGNRSPIEIPVKGGLFNLRYAALGGVLPDPNANESAFSDEHFNPNADFDRRSIVASRKV